MSRENYSHILKYIGLFGSIEFLNILIAIIRNKFVALILGPQGMGLIAVFNSTITFLSNSCNFGIPISAVRNISETYESLNKEHFETTINSVRIWSILTAIFGTLACAALSPLLSKICFSNEDYTLHFICLSPIIAMIAITGGETAILKGTRQLNQMARISILNVVAALITSVPLFYLFGESAIVVSLIIIAIIHMLLTITTSYKLHPAKIKYNKKDLTNGSNMVKLGIAFVFAGIMGSGADFVIRSYISNTASIDTVGLYNAGYMMTMVYAGMVFSAMETDFYPRLSAVNENCYKSNQIVNNQIEVSLLLVSPMLTALMIGLPIVLPMLYSKMFMPVIPMMQIVILAMYSRAMKLPMAYLTLAKGDSKSYLLLEAIYDILVVMLTIVCFSKLQFIGAGIAITTTSTIDILIVYSYTHYKYNYQISSSVIKYFLIHISIGSATFIMVSNITNNVLYWLYGTLLATASAAFSIIIMQSKTSLWNILTNRFRKK